MGKISLGEGPINHIRGCSLVIRISCCGRGDLGSNPSSHKNQQTFSNEANRMVFIDPQYFNFLFSWKDFIFVVYIIIFQHHCTPFQFFPSKRVKDFIHS